MRRSAREPAPPTKLKLNAMLRTTLMPELVPSKPLLLVAAAAVVAVMIMVMVVVVVAVGRPTTDLYHSLLARLHPHHYLNERSLVTRLPPRTA